MALTVTERIAARYLPALMRDEARFSVLIHVLGGGDAPASPRLDAWGLGGPLAVAALTPGYDLTLGNLTLEECAELVELSGSADYSGIAGTDETPARFVAAAQARGVAFAEPLGRWIHTLEGAPAAPGSRGSARRATADDVDLLHEWALAFHKEAIPNDPLPERARVAKAVDQGRMMLWVVDGEPVALAGLARLLSRTGAVSSVYTPPPHRGRGYAGSVTCAVVDQIRARGRPVVCLHTDARNPASNRCYAKIGFKRIAEVSVYLKVTAPSAA